MRKVKIVYLPVLALVTLMAFLSACKKFIDIAPPLTQAESSKVFSSDQTATSATIGLYYQITSSNLTYLNGAITVYTGLSSDELIDAGSNSTYDAFENNAIPSNLSAINSAFWSNAYKYIYQANAVIEGLNSSATLSKPVKDQLMGEMLFTRALNYFYLVNLFGDVPLEISTDYLVNSTMPRTAASKVNDQIINDLLTAETLLTTSYSSSTNTRPNEMAAAALLARLYLYQKDWVNAETQASKVINSGSYILETNLNNVFLATSGETIFQLARPANNTAEGLAFIPYQSSVKPTFAVRSSLLNAFTSGDNRKTSWLKGDTISGTAYYFPYKYKQRINNPVTEYNVVLRLAELYLIRAEVRAAQNNTSGAQADINMIRNRAGLTNTTASNSPGLLVAVASERQLELFAEWGHRWLDLKRSGTINSILGTTKTNWQASDALYPIPLAQTQLNHLLTQNSGY
jgi:hypothetical protein